MLLRIECVCFNSILIKIKNSRKMEYKCTIDKRNSSLSLSSNILNYNP